MLYSAYVFTIIEDIFRRTSSNIRAGDPMNVLSINKIITAVLLITISVISVMGCNEDREENTAAGDENTFYRDRVVTVRITMTEENWESTRANPMAEQYVKADLSYNGKTIPDVAVRPKGGSSLMTSAASGTPRFSLKVDFNFYHPARNLYGIKKLNFNNGFSDPTLIREFLAYELFKQMGIPSPRASFVDLWVNDTRLGLYTMIEQVDKDFLANNFVNNSGNLYKPEMPAGYLSWTEDDLENQQSSDEVSAPEDQADDKDINLGGGKLAETRRVLKPEDKESHKSASSPGFMPRGRMMSRRGMGPPEGFQLPEGFELPEGFRLPDGFRPPEGFGPPLGEGMMPGMPGLPTGSYLEQMDLKTNEGKPDHSLLFRLLDILNNEPDATFPDEIKKVLDVDNVLRFLAVSVAIVHLDNYIGMGHNYYLYEDNGKFVIIPWDLNMVFGTFNFGLDRDQLINFYIDEPTGGPVKDRPLVDRLLFYQPYFDTYRDYLEEFLDGPFNIDHMSSRIDEVAEMVRPFVSTDELKFFSTEEFERGLAKDLEPVTTQRFMPGALENVMGLKTFVRERSESIRKQFNGIIKSRSGDGSGNGGSFGFPGFMP